WESGYYPALRTNFDNTTDGLQIDVWTPRADYLRIKSVQLGYNFSPNVASSIGLDNARVYITGFNLYTFTDDKLKEIDPEKQEGAWDANLTYPLMKSFNLGINLNF